MEKEFVQKPVNGFVLGKFMPPHKGHQYLCNFAANYVQNLTILVCSLREEPIAGELRFKWMKEMFPNCNVVYCNEQLPQWPHEDPNFWQIWNDVVIRYSNGIKPDVIFASEQYGQTLADNLNVKFVPCDISRTAINCSGTMIRENPGQYWNFIPDVVKPYFVKRICLAGVESTGKTTLAQQLTKELKTVMVPEYGRTYTEFFGVDVKACDICNIVKGHIASRDALARFSGPTMIEDTDAIMSAVWSDMLVGERDQWFSTFNDYADLYLLCDIDLPWVNDGTRYFPDDESRKKFHEKIEQELIDRKVNYVVVKGVGPARFINAKMAILNFYRKNLLTKNDSMVH